MAISVAPETFKTPAQQAVEQTDGTILIERIPDSGRFTFSKVGTNGSTLFYYNISEGSINDGSTTYEFKLIDGVSYVKPSVNVSSCLLLSLLSGSGVLNSAPGRVGFRSSIVKGIDNFVAPVVRASDGVHVHMNGSSVWVADGSGTYGINWSNSRRIMTAVTTYEVADTVSFYSVNPSTGVETAIQQYCTLQAGYWYPFQIELQIAATPDELESDEVEDPFDGDLALSDSGNVVAMEGPNGMRRIIKAVTAACNGLVNTIYTAVFGRGNEVLNTTDSVIGGSNNRISAMSNGVCLGHGNVAEGSVCSTILGAGNLELLNSSVRASKRYNTLVGSHNKVTLGKDCALIGRNNIAQGRTNVVAVGNGLQATTSTSDGTVLLGAFNAEATGMAEVFGGGTSATRANIRTLSTSGVEKCQGWFPMTSVTAKPTTAPAAVGLWRWDSTNKCFYVAVGTSAASDWKTIALS